MSKRFHTTFMVKELFVVAEVTKEAVVYAILKSLLILTPTKCIMEAEA